MQAHIIIDEPLSNQFAPKELALMSVVFFLKSILTEVYTQNSSAVLASLDYCGSVGDAHVKAIHNNFYKTFVHKYCTESKIVEKILHLGLT